MTKLHCILALVFLQIAPALVAAQNDGQPKVNIGLDFAPESTKQNRQRLIGTWYRYRETTQGGVDSEISTLREDGAYMFRFKRTDSQQETWYYTETGFWGISADIHFSIKTGIYRGGEFQPARSNNHENYIAYKILEISSNRFTYQTITDGNVFTSKRVADGFGFPEEQAADKRIQHDMQTARR